MGGRLDRTTTNCCKGIAAIIIMLHHISFRLSNLPVYVKPIWYIAFVGFGSVAYLVGIVLTAFGGHQDKLPALLAFPVNIYFSIFATTRNGFFQSLVFVSLGMYIADIEKSGELTKILHKGKIALFAYLIKIPISLIGGAVPQPDA